MNNNQDYTVYDHIGGRSELEDLQIEMGFRDAPIRDESEESDFESELEKRERGLGKLSLEALDTIQDEKATDDDHIEALRCV